MGDLEFGAETSSRDASAESVEPAPDWLTEFENPTSLDKAVFYSEYGIHLPILQVIDGLQAEALAVSEAAAQSSTIPSVAYEVAPDAISTEPSAGMVTQRETITDSEQYYDGQAGDGGAAPPVDADAGSGSEVTRQAGEATAPGSEQQPVDTSEQWITPFVEVSDSQPAKGAGSPSSEEQEPDSNTREGAAESAPSADTLEVTSDETSAPYLGMTDTTQITDEEIAAYAIKLIEEGAVSR